MHHLKNWLPVLCLALAGFIFVTTELMPIGILPDLARDMNQSQATTGLLVTVYAWVVAITSLPLTLALGRVDRRTLLLAMLGVFIAGQWLAAAATSFAMLMGARVMTSLSHALFWSITPPLAVRVAPAGQPTRALSVVAAISSLASILGMPLGAVVSNVFGWRVVFVVIGLLALIIMIILAKYLPPSPGSSGSKTRQFKSVIHNRELRRIYALTALTVTGHFTAFTYMRPLLAQNGGFSPEVVAGLLLLLGLAGIVGNLTVSRQLGMHPKASLILPLASLSLCLLAAQWASASMAGAVGLCLAWGMSMGAATLVYQSTVIKAAPEAPDVANSIYSAIFNVGIGGGALAGNNIYNSFGVSAVTFGSAGLFIIAALISLSVLSNKVERRAAS